MYPSLLPPPHSRLPAAHSFCFPRHNRRIPSFFWTRTLITLRTHKLPRLSALARIQRLLYARVGCTSAEFREQVDDVPTGETSAVRKTTVPLGSLRREIGSDQTLLNAVACPTKMKEKRGLGKEQSRLHDYHHCETRRRRTRSYAHRVHVLGSTRARRRESCTSLRCEERKTAQCLSTCRCNTTANTKAAAAAAVVVARRTSLYSAVVCSTA